jgi:uncharacterized protein (DUF1800 family)
MSEPESDDRAILSRREFIGAALGTAALTPRALALTAAKTAHAAAPADLPPPETIALSRLAFGPTPAELEALRSGAGTPRRRVAAWVESQLHPGGLEDKDCERRLAAAKLGTLAKDAKTLWTEHSIAANVLRDKSQAERKAFDAAMSSATAAGESNGARAGAARPAAFDDNKLRTQPVRELEAATWLRAVYSRRQLSEVLADFWHDHFNVYAWDAQIAPTFVPFDRDVIRRHALGNFRAMLEDVAKSPAMLFYLDNALSQSANPNENYARELFELHALGAENYLGTKDRREVPGYDAGEPVGYVDGDVYEAARALTGWRVANGRGVDDTGEFLYYEPWHDRFQQIVLGRPLQELQPPMKDGRDVLDLLADHPGTARYISRKLCRRLVGDAPSAALVAAAAKTFRAERRAPDQLRRVVRLIALSDEFRATWGGKMRRPFEVVVAMLRATGAEFSPSDAFLVAQGRAGQRLFQWRTPDGYPDDHTRWGGTSQTLERWRAANLLMSAGWEGARADPFAQTPAKLRTPREVARWWCARVLGRPASRATSDSIASFLAQGRNPGSPLSDAMLKERLSPAVALALMSPEFQVS